MTKRCTAAVCAALGIIEGAGHFPEFIFSVLSLIQYFAPFSLKCHILPDTMAFQSSFRGEFFVCFLLCFLLFPK